MNWSELPGLFPALDSPARWLPLLQRHHELITAAAAHTRVTSVAPEEAVRRQYAESLELWRIMLDQFAVPPARVVDIGSGGGYPGLVLACVAPATHFDLVEPLQKRARLLRTAADELGLANVNVHPLRAEEAGRGPLRESADAVTARAVAELRELIEYAAPFGAPGALLVFAKGSALEDELAAATNAVHELAVEWVATTPMRRAVSEQVRIATFRRRGALSERYPRRPGVPSKRPL